MGTSVALKKVYAGLALGWWCTYGSSRIKTVRRRTCDLDWRLDNDGVWDFITPHSYVRLCPYDVFGLVCWCTVGVSVRVCVCVLLCECV